MLRPCATFYTAMQRVTEATNGAQAEREYGILQCPVSGGTECEFSNVACNTRIQRTFRLHWLGGERVQHSIRRQLGNRTDR